MPDGALRLTLCWTLLALAACGAREATPAGDADYEARGEIARLPDATSPEIWLRHEAIPDFRNPEGEVVGMESMTMSFKVAPGVALVGLAPGDRVAFRFQMRWSGPASMTVARIERLPEGTRLAWEPEAPLPGTDPPADQSAATPR
jgi:Cu/Ag efflux protein CusF